MRAGFCENRRLGVAAFVLWTLLVAAAIPSSAQQVTEIDVWTWSYPDNNLLDTLIAAFESANPGIKVNRSIVVPGTGGYYDAVLVALAAEAGPDVFLIDNIDVPAWAELGRLAPLDKYIPEEVVDDFWPSIHPIMRHQGRLYAVPHHMSVTTFVYNLDHFAEAGIVAPGDYTWEELVEDAKRLTIREGGAVARYGLDVPMGADEGGLFHILPFIQMNGGDFLDEEGRVILGEPAALEALEFLYDLIYAHEVRARPGTPGLSFTSQTISSGWTWHSNIGNYRLNFPDLNFDVAHVPRPSSGVRVAGIGGWYWAMSAKSDNPDAAGRFMAYLASEEFIRSWQGLFQPPISRRSVALEYVDAMDPRDVKVLNSLEYGRIRPRHPKYTEMARHFWAAIAAMYHRGEHPRLVMPETVRLMRAELDR